MRCGGILNTTIVVFAVFCCYHWIIVW